MPEIASPNSNTTRDGTSESKARLKGLFNIAVTPFMPDGGIDVHGLAESIERLLGMDFDGFLIGGTYGEFATMSAEERATLFRHVVEVSAVARRHCFAAPIPIPGSRLS